MIPILYDANETAFTSNGLGRLTDCISCEVTEERNGVYEVEFVYPVSGIHYDDIQIGCIIYTTHDATKAPQPFDIYKRSVPIDGCVTFNAHHISYRLSTIVAKPFTITGNILQIFQALKNNAVNPCPFDFTSDKSASVTYKQTEPAPIRERLSGVEGSILDVFGSGDYEFDHFHVRFLSDRGADRGVSIRYGKNLTNITADSNMEGAYTGCVPYWNGETGMVTLPEWYILADNLPTGYPVKLIAMDLSDEFEEAPTAAQLRALAKSKLNSSNAWLPDENIEIEFEALWQTTEYADVEALQRVLLCDTVGIYYKAAGVAVKKRVITTVYDSLLDRYVSLELGQSSATLADTIRQRTDESIAKVTQILSKTYASRGYLDDVITYNTQLITGGLGGNMVIGYNANGKPEEALWMDTDNTQTAVNVIRINKNGIGFSTNGYQGPYISAWTIAGVFNTDFIKVTALSALSANMGTLTAGKIQSNDYRYTDGSTFNDAGLIIDMDAKTIRSTKFVLTAAGRLVASDAHLVGSLVTRNTANTQAVSVSSGGVDFYNVVSGTDTIAMTMHPSYWSTTYKGTGNKGTSLTVATASNYLSLGYLDSGSMTNYTGILINKSLNPTAKGYTEKVLLFSTFRAINAAVFSDAIYAGSVIYACKNVDPSTGMSNYGNRSIFMTTTTNDYGVLRFNYTNPNDASGFLTKTIIAANLATGAVEYSSGTMGGPITITGDLSITGMLSVTDAVLSGILTAGNVLTSGVVRAEGKVVSVGGAVGSIKDSSFDNAIWIYYDPSDDNAQLNYKNGSVSKNVINVGSDGAISYAGGTFATGPVFNGSPLPKSGSLISLGARDQRWYQVWSTSFNFETGVYINYNSTNDYIYASKTIHQGSDENLKNITPYDPRYDQLIELLEPVIYTWKDSAAKKTHAGLGARATKHLVDSLGLMDSGFVGIEHGEDGAEIYSVDYSELAVMLLHMVQKLKKEVDNLKGAA